MENKTTVNQKANTAEHYALKGHTLQRQQNYEKAIYYYNKSIEKDDKNSVTNVYRAMAFIQLKEYDKTAEDCLIFLDIEPKNQMAVKYYIKSQIGLGELDAAVGKVQDCKDKKITEQVTKLKAIEEKMINNMEQKVWTEAEKKVNLLLAEIDRSKNLHILKITILTKKRKLS